MTVVLVWCCARSTGPESGRLGVNAAVVAAEQGNLPTHLVVTTPVQFGYIMYYAILVEVDRRGESFCQRQRERDSRERERESERV